jgi:hypothetical protein
MLTKNYVSGGEARAPVTGPSLTGTYRDVAIYEIRQVDGSNGDDGAY